MGHDGPREMPRAAPRRAASHMIEIRNLEVRYGTTVAVDGLSLSIRAGSLFGLLGPNGAGKTTTLHCLAGLRRPHAGQVVVDGIDATREPRRLRRVLGLVPQHLALYPTLSVEENLRIFGGLVGLGGRRLRALCDEGRTIVYTTHHLEEVEALSDEVAIVDHGRIVAEGDLSELLSRAGGGTRYDVELAEEAPASQLERALAAQGLPVTAVRPAGMRLEDLFLRLTGRALRDGEARDSEEV